jgi:hypothetical protein
MTKPLVSILVVAGLLAAALALNPSADKHRSKIKESIAERSQVDKVLGLGHLAAFVAQYHSLGVASYTTVNGKVASVGAFGLVLTPD